MFCGSEVFKMLFRPTSPTDLWASDFRCFVESSCIHCTRTRAEVVFFILLTQKLTTESAYILHLYMSRGSQRTLSDALWSEVKMKVVEVVQNTFKVNFSFNQSFAWSKWFIESKIMLNKRNIGT